MTDDERKQSCDIGSNIRELIGEAVALQVHPDRVGEAEQHTGRCGVKRIVATKHDSDDSNPSAARAHIFGKDANRAKRQLRTRKTCKRTGCEHSYYPVADDVHAERLSRLRLLAYAS